MKKLLMVGAIFLTMVACVILWTSWGNTVAEVEVPMAEEESDIPAILSKAKAQYIKEDFLKQRAGHFGLLRGLTEDNEVNPDLRKQAIAQKEKQEAELARRPNSDEKNFLLGGWTAIGPNPIPNGSFPWSGRTIAIAVHPSNPDIVYVGTAQGGLYRSTDGGLNWTPLMDDAQSLAIGAIAISPSQPETVYVGTGEHNFSLDSFFGVGVYRIDNASTTATITGPLNKDTANNDVFTGRGISNIIVHPTDPNTIFVGSSSGVGGIGGAANNILPSRGVFRSTNAAGANPTFTKLTGLAGNLNASTRDIAIDPINPNILIVSVIGTGGTGGIYRSTDALAANPTFAQTEIFNSSSTSELTAEFAAIHPVGNADATFYAATGNLGGRVLKSTNGGASWSQQIDNNFCTPQCFYDIAVAVDPANADRVYLGGSPALVFGFSTNGGTSFTSSGAGVHVDTHAITVSKSNPSVIYLGTDGGIYKSTNSGSSWQSLNNTQFFATQFMSLALHPFDPNFTIGGTQDNGTNFYSPAGTWTRVDGGDGGFTVIDQNAADTTNVRMYHTYFNSLSSPLVGYATRANTSSGWSFRGCQGSPVNGINCNDTAILFYAPLERGPGNPNTIYYGSDRLYRSSDTGLNHTVVSQAPITSGDPISAIGISPQNDNVRIVGLRGGGVWGTSSGSTTLDNLDPSNTIPNGFIARAVIDPNNQNTAYVTVGNFGVTNLFKTTNLNAAPPTWSPIIGSGGNTLPQVPVNAFVVDPQNSNTLYAGTDIGVYVSTDGGANWSPFGTGLPRVAVFGMGITNADPRKLRIATHGKGMYEISLNAETSTPFDYDGDGKTDISIFRPTSGQWWIQRSSDFSTFVTNFGISSDRLVPGDYTGDGKNDIAFFRPSLGEWFVLRSENSTFYSLPFGSGTDIPSPADYDGDGKTDVAVFRPSTGEWFILKSTGGTRIETFGSNGDQPVAADYDGDGFADIAIYRPSNGQWWLNRSNNGLIVLGFGTSTDRTVQGDYTGDGKADVAIWRPGSGEWFVLRSEDFSFYSVPFGISTDIPVPGDYDGDGIQDIGVFRESNATWFVNGSQSGQIIQSFGASGDIPTPNSFVR